MASLNSDGAWCSMLFSISIKKLSAAAYVLLSYRLNSKATSSVPTAIFSINVLLAPSRYYSLRLHGWKYKNF